MRSVEQSIIYLFMRTQLYQRRRIGGLLMKLNKVLYSLNGKNLCVLIIESEKLCALNLEANTAIYKKNKISVAKALKKSMAKPVSSSKEFRG